MCFAQEHGVCDGCGETRAWRYQGAFYCAGDGPQSLCPWCIATVACLFRCLQCGQHRLHVDMGWSKSLIRLVSCAAVASLSGAADGWLVGDRASRS
ncbi:CbrC family protein [uncultured Xanthomonas sp.]|uniref:CbrC family protein n=1 Tax=uncultured Xanthomonas sp. TaxID=152831 RepID=UPI0025EC0F12|nr:CbrC family protein [uncultured Xanthomonas sp.]